MKKLFIFLAVVAMIIAPAIGFGQITQQDLEQLKIIRSGINTKKVVIKNLQEKILYISLLEREIRDLKLVDSIGVLTPKQTERRDDCLFAREKFLIENPYLKEKLAEEIHKLEVLEEKAEAIKMYAATNDDTPEEPGYFQGRRLKKSLELKDQSLNIKEKESKVNFNNRVRELALEKLEGSINESPFTMLLVNYSKLNDRQFILINEATGESTSYCLKPGEIKELKVLPGKYFCDIQDMASGKTRKGNYANVGIKTHYIEGKEVNAFFYAPKYF